MMLEELYLSTRMKDDILLCPVSQSVAREQTVVDPRYCLHSHPLSWDWQTQDNNRETPHVNTYLFLFSCSGLWSRREIIYRLLFFLWESAPFPRPVWQESLTKSFVLDWLIGCLESECVFDGDWSLIWWEELSHHTHPQLPSSHFYSFALDFSL